MGKLSIQSSIVILNSYMNQLFHETFKSFTLLQNLKNQIILWILDVVPIKKYSTHCIVRIYVGWQNVSAEALKGCYNPSPSLKDDILNDMKSTSSANDIPRPPPLSPFDRFAISPLGIPFRHWHHFCWYPWITHFIHFSKTLYV